MDVEIGPTVREDAAGCLRVNIVASGLKPGEEASIELSIPGRGQISMTEAADAGGVITTWCGLMTHLLDDGASRIDWMLRASESKSGSFGVTVRNGQEISGPVAESLRRQGVPLFVQERVESKLFDYTDMALLPWFERPDALETVSARLQAGEITEKEAEALQHFVEQGFVMLDSAIEESLVAKVNSEIDDAVKSGYQGYRWGSSDRIEHLHLHYPNVRQLWTHPVVMRYLKLIFGAPAKPCQTLTYAFGSQQDLHQDCVHLTPFPAGYMCGVWIALEDIQEGSGELQVVPKSHRFPRVYRELVDCERVKPVLRNNTEEQDWSEFGAKVVGKWSELLGAHTEEPISYTPVSGSVLIWHENLMHGGAKRVDESKSRRSIVSHYFAEGSIAYYDSTALPGNMSPA